SRWPATPLPFELLEQRLGTGGSPGIEGTIDDMLLVRADVLEDDRRATFARLPPAAGQLADEPGPELVVIRIVVDLAEQNDRSASQGVDECLAGDGAALVRGPDRARQHMIPLQRRDPAIRRCRSSPSRLASDERWCEQKPQGQQQDRAARSHGLPLLD